MTKKKDMNEDIKDDIKKDEPVADQEADETDQNAAEKAAGEAEAEGTEAGGEPKSEEEDAKSKEEESFETKYLRMAADFQNFKRRTDEEKSKIYANANEKFASDLLEVLDNFERAIEQDRKNEADAPFLKGMELILKQLQDVLSKNGIEEIVCLGEEFDPNFHHAVAMECSDKYGKGCVMDVMQKGYKIKDRVIRPSMVRVAE